MLIYLFSLVIIIHAMIHAAGFSSIIGKGGIQLYPTIMQRFIGILWMSTCILLLTIPVSLFAGTESLYKAAIAAVIIPQFLIGTQWKTAKWGSLVNLGILIIAIPALANNQFNKMASLESRTILARMAGEKEIIVTREMLDSLPPIVQKWIIHSGIIGKKQTSTVRLKQKGTLRTSPSGKWMPFTATQYFTVNEPAFVWAAHIAMAPGLYITGRDKFENGCGEMTIRLFSLFNIGGEKNTPKTDTASMLRYLAESCMFPSAAIGNFIKWQPIDTASSKAIMVFHGMTVSGIFNFTPDGDFKSFTADRYYAKGSGATLEKWSIQCTGWKDFEGIRIPSITKVTWKLATGDFYWANFEVTDLAYNCTEIYQ